jgi:hypothetical protein
MLRSTRELKNYVLEATEGEIGRCKDFLLIENSPEYNSAEPPNREYEDLLYNYYGFPPYW